MKRSIVGWREYVALPEVGISSIKAKLDTGARTSALHAEVIEEFSEDGIEKIKIRTPQSGHKSYSNHICALHDIRNVKNTSGIPEARHVILTRLILGRHRWPIELTLTNRENMKFDLILGRTAIRQKKMCVHPGKSFLAGTPQSVKT